MPGSAVIAVIAVAKVVMAMAAVAATASVRPVGEGRVRVVIRRVETV